MRYRIWLILILAAAAVLSAGCATVTMTKTGEDVTWTSKTLFKDIAGVKAEAGAFTFDLGNSSYSPDQAKAVMCLLSPGACK